MKDQKDKQCRFIFTAAFALLIFIKGANFSGGHFVYNTFKILCIIYIQPKCFVTNKCGLFGFSIHQLILEKTCNNKKFI